jgi:glucose-6-phosphate 1-dehydrogenase
MSPPDWIGTRRAYRRRGESPSYIDETGVDPARGTETFAELILAVEAPRWRGTRFVFRGGKALSRRRKEAVIRSRPSMSLPALPAGSSATASELRIGLDGPTRLALSLVGGAGLSSASWIPPVLDGPSPRSGIPAYGRVLLELLSGGSELSARGDEAEQAWRVVEPILHALRGGRVPLEEYVVGSEGPPSLDASVGLPRRRAA